MITLNSRQGRWKEFLGIKQSCLKKFIGFGGILKFRHGHSPYIRIP